VPRKLIGNYIGVIVMSNRFEKLEEQVRILGELAASYPRDSQQYNAIENAALAMIFAVTEQYEAFSIYVASKDNELSEKQKEFLRDVGLSI